MIKKYTNVSEKEWFQSLLYLKWLGTVQVITVCKQLATATCLLKTIDDRFHHIFSNADGQLAAVVHLKFKLDWTDRDMQRSNLSQIFKRHALALATQNDDKQSVASHSSEQPSSTVTADFFAEFS